MQARDAQAKSTASCASDPTGTRRAPQQTPPSGGAACPVHHPLPGGAGEEPLPPQTPTPPPFSTGGASYTDMFTKTAGPTIVPPHQHQCSCGVDHAHAPGRAASEAGAIHRCSHEGHTRRPSGYGGSEHGAASVYGGASDYGGGASVIGLGLGVDGGGSRVARAASGSEFGGMSDYGGGASVIGLGGGRGGASSEYAGTGSEYGQPLPEPTYSAASGSLGANAEGDAVGDGHDAGAAAFYHALKHEPEAEGANLLLSPNSCPQGQGAAFAPRCLFNGPDLFGCLVSECTFSPSTTQQQQYSGG